MSVLSAVVEHHQMTTQPIDPKTSAPKKKARPLQVALAIFWSFFGVRKRKNWQEDATSITPVQAIIGGIIGALIFIFALLMIVRMVTHLGPSA